MLVPSLHSVAFIPVRKAWVKKKPEIQNTSGGPLSNQSCRHEMVKGGYHKLTLNLRQL